MARQTARLACLLALLAAAPLLAYGLEATITFNLNNGTAVSPDNTITLPETGNCTDTCQALDEGLNLTSDRNKPPILVTVAAAPGGTGVSVIAFGSADCTGANRRARTDERGAPASPRCAIGPGLAAHARLLPSRRPRWCTRPIAVHAPMPPPACSTSSFFDFQSNSISVDTDSSFPSYVQSFLLCTDSSGGR
eukprot:scaffold2.g6984.t1